MARERGASAAPDPDVPPTGAVSAKSFGRDRDSVIAREKEQFGGVKPGSAFFGWLAATGTAVLLTALAAAAGAAVGVANTTGAQDAIEEATTSTAALVSGIVLLVILFVSYYCGGYVAGRMARFDGAKQGVAVWLWGVVIAVVVGIIAAIAGDQFNVLSQVNSLPRLPVGDGDVTTAGIITLLLVAAASLAGAILGGLAGMRFHRKVDRAGLGR